MKKKDICLALVLLLCVVVVCGAILFAESIPDYAQSSAAGSYRIVINEICTKNESIITDNDGKYRDYIELYNSGEAVSLEGFTLNDGKVSCTPFGKITLEHDEYLVVFLGNDLTGFALGASGGDCIQLLDRDGNIAAQANTASLLKDQVMLYRSGIYETSYNASPGYANNAGGVAAFSKGSRADSAALIISELLIGNESSLPDERGIYSDVIELHNTSDETVNLRHYCLSDDEEQRYKYRLPSTELAPGMRALVFCDGENYVDENGEIHANFAISHGESLTLTNSRGEYTLVTAEFFGENLSQILSDNGQYVAGAVSLGYENSDEGAVIFLNSRINEASPLMISELLLSSADVPYNGVFQDVVEIVNCSGEEVSTEGWYLCDGGDPYAYPLPKQTLKPGEYLVIPCSPQTTGFSLSEGETVILTAPDYRQAVPVACTAGEAGKSISLRPGDDASGYAFSDATLGYPNTAEGRESYRESQLGGGVLISEVMSANQSYLKGPYAATADWIELYNASGSAINLSEYNLSDRSSDTERYALPDMVLEAGEYCVIFLKSDPTNLNPGYEVLPFSLSSSGDTLYLSRNAVVVDYVIIPELSTDESYGRAEGDAKFSLLSDATPGGANSSAAEKCAMPSAVTAQGCYDGIDYLDVELLGSGDIYYTTDGAAPDADAALYTGPIRLTETTIIRAVCRQPGKLDSDVLNLSYIINEYDTLPVVTVVTDPENLWDDGVGIYVPGPNADTQWPFFGANFWMDWEKPACVSLFETDGSGFSANCGIKIFGGYTVFMPKKSLACNFRDVYGCSALRYPLFGEDSFDTYESFVLRSTGQDAYRARMRDVVVTSLFSEYTDVPVQKYKPVIVYLNDRYWGLHYIREKINSNYLAAHFNSPPDTLTVVKFGGWTSPEYIDLVKYTAENDMSVQEHYNYVCSQIDVDNYIDFIIAEMWVANTDPGNVKYFLSPEGKWTWFLFDTDLGLLEYDLNTVRSYLSPLNIGVDDVTSKTFAAKLMQNEEFRDKFLRRMAWQMNNIWTEENLKARVDEICSLIIADIPRECERWGYSYESWENSVNEIRLFAEKRNEYMLEYIRDWFGLTSGEMRAYGFEP